MKIASHHIVLFLLVLISSLQACVNDDSFFPEVNGDEVVKSIAIVTALQNFGRDDTTIPEENQCFRFVYPITLGYNTDATIQVNTYDGLLEILKSQRTNFNISGLQFPVQVVFKGSDTTISIPDEESFLAVLSDCEINSLRQDFDRFNANCFRLKYPVVLFDPEGNETELNSEEELKGFLMDQGARYQPLFKFPVIILKEPDFDADIEIQTYYGFYRVLESCGFSCPVIDISDDVLNDLTLEYLFFAETTDPEIQNFSWFVNGDFITNEVGNQFQYQFPGPGSYEVCAQIETPQCPNGIKECITIRTTNKCPELSFVWERIEQSFEHRFTANFDRKEDLVYQWFVDDEFIEEDGGPNGDNILAKILEPDSRKVCIKARVPSCPEEVVEYCETIPVEQNCPDLFFTAEQRGTTTTYDFVAEFPGMDIVEYSWFVDDTFVENDGGANGDNSLVQEFASGTHEICIKAETTDCFFPVEFCEQITIP